MDEINKLKKKHIFQENELIKMQSLISDACQDANRSKFLDNFKDIDGSNGNLRQRPAKSDYLTFLNFKKNFLK